MCLNGWDCIPNNVEKHKGADLLFFSNTSSSICTSVLGLYTVKNLTNVICKLIITRSLKFQLISILIKYFSICRNTFFIVNNEGNEILNDMISLNHNYCSTDGKSTKQLSDVDSCNNKLFLFIINAATSLNYLIVKYK